MKTFIFFARVGAMLLIFGFLQPAFAQINSDQYPNYVVIGAFSVERNALKLTNEAKAAKYSARFDINPNRNLYYVYVSTITDHEEALKEATRLRQDTKYKDAWVYQGAIGKTTGPEVTSSKDVNPVTQEVIQPVSTDKEEQPTTETEGVTPTEPSVDETAEKPPVDKTLTAENIGGKSFVFQMFRATDNRPVEGEVEIVEAEKAKRFTITKTNTPVKVPIPNSKSGKVIFASQVFGYRPEQREFNFKNPAESGYEVDDNGNVVIPFDMVRLQKGDIAVMYNVFFFKDAAIMRPESKFEVDNLLEMMKENPNCKIKIHGHTNGNAAGKIIRMGEAKNFFSLTGSGDGYGSAKQLSGDRAETIREYLMSNGIEDNRMEVKAWGGKRAIHDKHSQRAQENVRVEVEILEH